MGSRLGEPQPQHPVVLKMARWVCFAISVWSLVAGGAVAGGAEGTGLEDLRAAVHSADGNARRKAVGALGELGGEEVVGLLGEAYRAEAEDAFGVKAACAEALGRTGLPAAAAPLGEMVGDADYWVRKKAAEALGHVPGERARTALERAAADRDPRVRAEAVLAFGVRGEGWNVLEAALEDPDDRVVAAAVQAFATSATPEARSVLARAVQSPSWRVRYRAASALARMGEPEGIRALEQGIRDGVHVAAALREAGGAGEAAVPSLAAMFRAPDFPEKNRVLDALEAVQGEASTRFFVDLAGDGTADPEARVRAVSVLFDRRETLGAGDLERIAILLSAKDPNLVAVSLQILAEGAGSRYLEPIRPLARHENPVVRHFALVNLATFGGPELEPVFLQALADANGANVRLALDALGRVGTRNALPTLRPLLEEPRLRRYAQAAIEAIEARP